MKGKTLIKKHRIYVLICIITALQVFRCSPPERIAGGNSSETVIGILTNVDGSPACSTVVTMYPRDYNPVAGYAEYLAVSDTTDDDGSYFLIVTDTLSEYTILAKSLSAGKSVLISDVTTFDDSAVVYDGVLENTGTITLLIPDAGEEAYAYIPGTDLVTEIDSYTTTLQLDSVPAGIISQVIYITKGSQDSSRTKYSVTVSSDDTALVLMADEDWGYLQRLYLNTSSSGADIAHDVYDFPVCVRMTGDNFNFTQANTDGTDIRFTKHDGSPLPFEIERWNPAAGLAEVWVAVDTVFGNNSAQYMIMYWGNTLATSASNSALVFDTAKGFQGVWHLSDEEKNGVNDATGNRFNGTQYGMNESSSVAGSIGKALHFDGEDDYIVAHGTADEKIDFPAGGHYSISLWAYADAIDSLWHGIAGKGHQQYYLQYKCFRDTAASWEFVEYEGGWNYSEYRTESTPYDNEWVYLTGIRNGKRQFLYVNGQLTKDTMFLREDEKERNTDGDFSIGCHLEVDMFPDMIPRDSTFFKGTIDEVRVMSTPLDSNWVKLCYMNQKMTDVLVEFREDDD
jgi:hypothetical protein